MQHRKALNLLFTSTRKPTTEYDRRLFHTFVAKAIMLAEQRDYYRGKNRGEGNTLE